MNAQLKYLLVVTTVMVLSGCRNTTTTPISPLGSSAPLSPLAPVQGSASLSPIQPVSGISTFGAPTRVPPPPTGASTPIGNYNTSSNWGQSNHQHVTGSGVSGAALGSNGLTRGVTDLVGASSNSVTGFENNIRQTGWTSEPNPLGNAGTTLQQSSVPAQRTTIQPAAVQPASSQLGGMRVIDLTSAPFPPGYVPPQNRPGSVGGTPLMNSGTLSTTPRLPQSVPFPSATAQAGFAPSPGLGQPNNSTFDRKTVDANAFAGRPSGHDSTTRSSGYSPLPTTEPYPSSSAANVANANDQLQWRRPSPKF